MAWVTITFYKIHFAPGINVYPVWLWPKSLYFSYQLIQRNSNTKKDVVLLGVPPRWLATQHQHK